MSPRRRISHCVGEEAGAAAAEFAVVSLIFISVMLGVIDVARLAWEFNSAKAATRAGARLAVVSPPAVSQLINFNAVTTCNLPGGSAVPSSCIGDFTCTSTSCTGGGTLNSANFNSIATRMRLYYGRIQNQNVVIDYKNRGLGVAGNPFGPDVDPLITVSVTGLTFQPIALQVFGVTFPIPAVHTTLTGEDLN